MRRHRGSCVVYKAELYGLPCAIKLLSQDASTWEEKQFTAEIDVLTGVKDENICQLYACSTDGPSRCLVLELMDISLEGRVCSNPSLGWEQRTYILVCVCRGLVHLHTTQPVAADHPPRCEISER
jgi:serine/threonine protein kinase